MRKSGTADKMGLVARISCIATAFALMLVMLPSICFAAEDTAQDTGGGLTLVATSPENGATDVAVDNFSIKLTFDKDMIPGGDADKSSNSSQFTLAGEDGVPIGIKVYYNEENPKQMLVAVDMTEISINENPISSNQEYTLTIGADLKATDGSTMGEEQTVKVKTINQQQSIYIYMVLMAAMMIGMVVFTVRSAKKAQEKGDEKKKKQKQEYANPYKEAKRTGKSVEEIVAKQSKAKKKQEEAEAKRKAAEQELEDRIREEIRKEHNKRVSKPRPISAAGSQYKVKVKADNPQKEQAKTSKGTTRPKNQTGKQKNKGKKK